MLNPRFPAPVNTYNPTVHALVDAVYDALSNIVPDKVRADGSGSRSIILGGRSTYTGKGYVQYEIIAGGAGARATKDGASGITVNQSNAMIAPVEIIESEFPTRIAALRADPRIPAAPARFRGGLGIRREYLNLEDARFSIRSMKHIIPPNGCAGGSDRPHRRHLDQSGQPRQAKRLPTRYADYPLKAGDIFRLDTPGRRRPRRSRSPAIPSACLPTCAKDMSRRRRPSATMVWCSGSEGGRGRSIRRRPTQRRTKMTADKTKT